MNNGHRVKSFGAPFRFCFTLDTEPDNLWDYSPGCSIREFQTAAGLPPQTHSGRCAAELFDHQRGRGVPSGAIGDRNLPWNGHV